MKERDSGAEAAVEAVLRKFEKQHAGDISCEQLELYVYENPSLCSPVFQAQDMMRKVLLGAQAWSRLLRKRQNSPDLQDYMYPFVLRDIIDSISARVAKKQNDRKKTEALKHGHTAGNNRKNSTLLNFFNVNKGKHVKQRTADAVRSSAQDGKNLVNANANETNFNEKKKTYAEEETKNIAVFKNYAGSEKNRPKSGKVDATKRGAHVQGMGDGVRIFAVQGAGSTARPKSAKSSKQ